MLSDSKTGSDTNIPIRLFLRIFQWNFSSNFPFAFPSTIIIFSSGGLEKREALPRDVSPFWPEIRSIHGRSREPEARQRKRERDLVRFETRRRNLFADRVCRPVCSSPLEFLRGSFIEMPRLLHRLPCSRKLVNGQSRIMSGIGGDESFTRNVCKGWSFGRKEFLPRVFVESWLQVEFRISN